MGRRVGNSGSKYDFEPEQFEKDVADKRQVAEDFTQELQDLMLYVVNPAAELILYAESVQLRLWLRQM